MIDKVAVASHTQYLIDKEGKLFELTSKDAKFKVKNLMKNPPFSDGSTLKRVNNVWIT